MNLIYIVYVITWARVQSISIVAPKSHSISIFFSYCDSFTFLAIDRWSNRNNDEKGEWKKKIAQITKWENVLYIMRPGSHVLTHNPQYLMFNERNVVQKTKQLINQHTAPSVKHESHYFSFRHCAVHINSPNFVWRLYNNKLLHR